MRLRWRRCLTPSLPTASQTPPFAMPILSSPEWQSRRRHVGRHGEDQALQEGGVPPHPRLGQYAGHGFRLPGSRQPCHGKVHEISDPVSADARPGHTTGAEHPQNRFTMFDFTGVTDFHGDDENVPAEGGFVITPEKGKETGESRGLLVLDINDHIDPTTRGWVTLDEDGNQIRTPEGDAKAAELGARFEAWLLSRRRPEPRPSAPAADAGRGHQGECGRTGKRRNLAFHHAAVFRHGRRRMVEAAFGGAAELERRAGRA